MRNFFNIVLYALRFKWSLAGAISSSVVIALLWSASIWTIYPIVEIVLDGKTGKQWLAAEIAKAETSAAQCGQEIETLKQELDNLPPDAHTRQVAPFQNQINRSQSRLHAEEKALQWYRWLEPYVERWAPDSPYQTLLLAIGWLLATSLVKGALLIVSTQLVARVANRTVTDLRRIYYRKALEMDQQRIEELGTSSMMTYLSHNMLMITAGLHAFFGRMIREPMKMITCLIGAGMISFPLLVITLAISPVGWLIVRSLTNRMKRATSREIDGMTGIFQTLMETFSAIKIVHIFNREATERRRFKRNANTLYRISQKMNFYDSLLRPIVEMMGTIAIAVAIMVGAYLVLNEETHLWRIRISDRPLTSTSLLLFFGFLAGASDPARKMSEVINQVVRAGMIADMLKKTFDQKPTVVAARRGLAVPKHSQSIRFDNVAFEYRPKQNAIDSVTFEVPFGQTIAIVGPNGCGKSTLMNLLARFYDPQQGDILLDGVNLRDLSPRKLRQQMAWVTQESTLFKSTIRENILYGKPDATEEEFMAAAERALVTHIVQEKPSGFGTFVGEEGRQLSAGQRQRVALARAILADPRILILDEATSQIDGKTETVLHEGLADFIKQRTTFIVTHRVSSLKLADRVLIMDNGKITFDGTPAEAWIQSKEFNFLFNKAAA